MKIPLQDIRLVKETNRDAVGCIFIWNDNIYRGINDSSVALVNELIGSGLIDELSDAGLFPRTWVTDFELDGYGMVLQHERIKPVTYPFEWSFGMLRDAALTILKVNRIAFTHGWQTKDCHGYNILFNYSQPVFIDLGSFIPRKGAEAWPAYEEFLAFYYYPLKIWSCGDFYLSRYSMLATHAMPHECYLSYRFPLLRHLGPVRLAWLAKLSIKFRRICSGSAESARRSFPGTLGSVLSMLHKSKLLRWNRINLELLGRKIDRIHQKKSRTTWGGYHDQFLSDSPERLSDPRFIRIAELIGEKKPTTVVDLAGNQGAFASLLCEKTAVESIYCVDSDEHAINSLYSRLKSGKDRVAPVLLDFMLPLQRVSTQRPHERFGADAVVALAVMHHLLLSQNMPIDYVLKTLRSYTTRYVFVEFMPKGLMGPDGTAPPVPEWYTVTWFRQELSRYFTVYHEESLAINRILFCGVVPTL